MGVDLEKSVGICTKKHDGFILERNEIAKSVCGNFCDQICLVKIRQQQQVDRNEDIHIQGFNTFQKLMTKESHVADIVVTEIDENLVTLIYPLDEQIKETLKKYDFYNLTPAEHKILSRLILGQSNKTIADALYISRSTLKKHINNIYKKIPENLRPRVGTA